MNRKQMLSERYKGVGGSDVAVIMGLSQYKTAYELFLEKKQILEPSDELTPNQEWGIRLEKVILDKFKELHEVEITTPDTIIHPIYPFMRANLDGFIPEKSAVLEIKCCMQFAQDQWGEEGTDQIPLPYLLQVAYYVACCNAEKAYIAVLIGGYDYREFLYERDKELESYIINHVLTFWDRVQNNDPPPPSTCEDLMRLYPRSIPLKSVQATAEIEADILELIEIKRKGNELDKKRKKLELIIKEYIGDAEALTDCEDNRLVTWKSMVNGRRVFRIKGNIGEANERN